MEPKEKETIEVVSNIIPQLESNIKQIEEDDDEVIVIN